MNLPDDIQKELARLQSAVEAPDLFQITGSLKAIFNRIMPECYTEQTLSQTCNNIHRILGDLILRCLEIAFDEFEFEGKSRLKILHMINTLGTLYENRFTEAINYFVSSDHLRYSRKIFRAIDYIDQNYQTSFGIDSIAHELEISPSYLSQLFRKETGTSIKQYVLDTRLKHAKRLLVDTRFKIFEVSERVGFSSSQYMSRLFKAREGMTPIQYRDLKTKT